MLPVEELFVHCYVLVDDLINTGAVVIPPRPGPAPACTDAEIIAIVLVRHMLGRRSESGFLAEIRREWPQLFPSLPHPSEVNRRARWLYGAYEQVRHVMVGAVPADDWGQIDTSALPVKHPSRVRGPDSWTGPNELSARFGRDAAHGEWFYGFRLAVRTDLSSRLVRSWAIVPAAVNERDLVPGLIEGAEHLTGLLNDKGSTAAHSPNPLLPSRSRTSCQRQRPNDTPCHELCRRSSRNGATASRPPSANSPTPWNSPDTALTPSTVYSPAPPPPSPPTASPGPRYQQPEPTQRASGVETI